MDNILKKIIYTGIWLLLLVPFVVSQNMFFPFITGKNVMFRVIVLVIAGAWAVLALLNKEYRPKKSWTLFAFIAFVVSLFISNLMSPNVVKSFWSNYERMEGWVTIFHLLGLFVVLASVLNTEKLWKRFLNSSIVVSVVISIYSMLQLMGALTINQGGVRVDATFGNATYLAIYMLFNIFIAGFLLVRNIQERSVYTRKTIGALGWWYISVITLNTIILYHTATRGAILGLIGGVLLTFILTALFEKKDKKVKKASIVIVGLVFVMVLGFFAIRKTSFVQNSMTLARISSISLQDGTTQSRFLIWDMAYKGFKEKPIFGWGQESFIYIFSKNYDPAMYGQEAWFDRAHNVFFDWLIAGGALGLLFYLSLFGSAVYLLWKKREKDEMTVLEKSLITGLLAGYFFHNIFVFDNIVSYIYFIAVLALVHHMRAEKVVIEKKRKQNEADENFFVEKIAPYIVVVLSIYGIYFFNAGAIGANVQLLDALKNASTGKLDDALVSFDNALAYDNFANQEIREQLAQLTNNMAGSKVPLEIKEKYFQKATEEMKKQIVHDKDNARLEVFLGSLYETYNFADEALVHLDRALELSPRKQNIMLEIASIKTSKGDAEGGFELFEEAYKSAPEYELAFFGYVMGAISTDRTELADSLLMERFGTTLVPNDLVIKAYNAKGNKAKVIELLRAKIEQNPTDAQAYFSLAAAYVDIGERTKSIEILEKTKAIVPDLIAQIDYYITEIRAGRNP